MARALRLEAVRAAFEPLPVDEHAASKYGELLAWVRDRRRSEKATDLLIAATAAATDRRLYTLDRRRRDSPRARVWRSSCSLRLENRVPKRVPNSASSDPSKPDPTGRTRAKSA